MNCLNTELNDPTQNKILGSLNNKEKDILDNSQYSINTNTDMNDKNNEYRINASTSNKDTRNQNTRKSSSSSRSDELLVNTGSGYVRGRSYYLDHHIPKNAKTNKQNQFGRKKYRVNAWLGIPFAEKPIGDLKFKRPVPIKPWDGVLNATALPNCCVQLNDTVVSGHPGVEMWNPNTNVSEDCLYLNIWAPHPVPKNSPVLVNKFIYYS